VLIDDLDLYDRFCLSEKVQRVMAWTRGCTFTPKYSLRRKYAHITATGKTWLTRVRVTPWLLF